MPRSSISSLSLSLSFSFVSSHFFFFFLPPPPSDLFSSFSGCSTLISHLIGSDLINFTENAIKRPQVAPGASPTSVNPHPFYRRTANPLSDPSNLSIQMREPSSPRPLFRVVQLFTIVFPFLLQPPSVHPSPSGDYRYHVKVESCE